MQFMRSSCAVHAVRAGNPVLLRRPPPPSAACAYAIISLLTKKPENDQMEAERLNAIENLLADLRRRAGELRGYL
jgi:hypothetical protein